LDLRPILIEELHVKGNRLAEFFLKTDLGLLFGMLNMGPKGICRMAAGKRINNKRQIPESRPDIEPLSRRMIRTD